MGNLIHVQKKPFFHKFIIVDDVQNPRQKIQFVYLHKLKAKLLVYEALMFIIKLEPYLRLNTYINPTYNPQNSHH